MFFKSSTGCMSSKQEAVISAEMMGMKGYQKQKKRIEWKIEDMAGARWTLLHPLLVLCVYGGGEETR